jgi:MFS superfamily sulfate permease-like transporter
MRPDLLAALSLWAVLVPQSLAYGQLAGLSPLTGLYCALAAMTAYALLGTSRYLNVGPESSVAVLVFAGSVLTARSLAARDRQDLDANREFVGLGAANIVAGFLQGFPANGSDSRSFVAANSGAVPRPSG